MKCIYRSNEIAEKGNVEKKADKVVLCKRLYSTFRLMHTEGNTEPKRSFSLVKKEVNYILQNMSLILALAPIVNFIYRVSKLLGTKKTALKITAKHLKKYKFMRLSNICNDGKSYRGKYNKYRHQMFQLFSTARGDHICHISLRKICICIRCTCVLPSSWRCSIKLYSIF